MTHKKRKQQLLATLPAEWSQSLLPAIQAQVEENGRKVVVLDDDPTGTQTVANIPVLTAWSVEALCDELSSDYPAFYILTNSRSMPEAGAIQINHEIGENLLDASRQTGRDFAIISRSDSTLRGHFPAEMDALTAVLQKHFDGWLLIPYFLEGGRFTIENIHYVQEGDSLIPAGKTPFAQDGTFGYHASDLREWVAEKSNGRIQPHQMLSISLAHIRQGGPKQIYHLLQQVSNGQVVIVNAVTMRDLEVFTNGLLMAEAVGKRFIYRTAASFVQVRAGLSPTPLLSPQQIQLAPTGGGLFVVGSYVPKTTRQINAMLKDTAVYAVEVQVEALLDEVSQTAEIVRVRSLVDKALANNKDVVIYTSRNLVMAQNGRSGLAIGKQISESLVQIVQNLSQRPRYLVAKGGITSSDIVTKALGTRRTLVIGQILPGVPMWELAGGRYPQMPYIIFPGNVGEDNALVTLLHKLSVTKA